MSKTRAHKALRNSIKFTLFPNTIPNRMIANLAPGTITVGSNLPAEKLMRRRKVGIRISGNNREKGQNKE
jgi:hypothetical protein